jgi:hypothetical protein
VNFRKLGGWLRRRLRDVATLGPALVEALGIKKKTVVGKGVDIAKKGDAVITIIEGEKKD